MTTLIKVGKNYEFDFTITLRLSEAECRVHNSDGRKNRLIDQVTHITKDLTKQIRKEELTLEEPNEPAGRPKI